MRKCPKCSATFDEILNFCKSCGAMLDTIEEPLGTAESSLRKENKKSEILSSPAISKDSSVAKEAGLPQNCKGRSGYLLW